MSREAVNIVYKCTYKKDVQVEYVGIVDGSYYHHVRFKWPIMVFEVGLCTSHTQTSQKDLFVMTS